MRTWWRHFHSGSEMHLVWLKDGEVTLGIAPLRLSGESILFIGGTDVCDYADFLVPRGKEDEFYGRLWDHLETLGWSTLDLRSIPAGSPTLQYLPALAEQSGYDVQVEVEDQAPVASLPSTWDEYLSRLTKKDRHELRRKLRRLDQAGEARQYVCTTVEAVDGGLRDFVRLLRESSPDKAAFMTPERERFFADIARELAARDELVLSFLEMDGVRVASCMNFDYEGSYLLYNSGYDPGYSHLSVGLLNKALSIKDAVERGRESFEFLRGTERYKYDLGAQDRAIYRLTVHR